MHFWIKMKIRNRNTEHDFSIFSLRSADFGISCKKLQNVFCTVSVPVSKSRNIPEVVLVRRWAVGVLGIWRGGVGWVKGGANGVSLQAT